MNLKLLSDYDLERLNAGLVSTITLLCSGVTPLLPEEISSSLYRYYFLVSSEIYHRKKS